MKHDQDISVLRAQSAEYLHPKTALAIWIVLILGLGSCMGIFFGPGAWFQGLVKPTWNPPGWVFGPAWTLLYVLMAISVWKVRRNTRVSDTERSRAMRFFWLQLLLNLAWTPIFFGLHQPAWAFVEICLLWLAALSTALAFGKISAASGYLLIPYLAWLSFALVLNGTIWLLNS
ncbi:MAG TPA: tryptophan-rich sensory protein [Arenimonas sp.]|nr:tryptophan-rich sensory protein [Arenimonas sp.]